MSKSQPRWHVPLGDGALCGNPGAWTRRADCARCAALLDRLLLAALDVAEGRPGGVEAVRGVVGRIGLTRED